MDDDGPMSPGARSCGAVMFSVLAAMLGVGIGWAWGLGLLPGIGWGLIACVAGLLIGFVVYWVWID